MPDVVSDGALSGQSSMYAQKDLSLKMILVILPLLIAPSVRVDGASKAVVAYTTKQV
eukprot:SAG31_NODE_585_length_13845_cov_25.623163_7_plen_57_part_00